jgi:hypothetical protein
MKTHILAVWLICLILPSCTSFLKPAGWPVEVVADKAAVGHTIEHVRFVGSTRQLTKQENALLTFLDKPDNIAAAVGKVNHPGAHQWTAAEIYRVDPGKHISVLCENGYQQVAVYFHYREHDLTWFRVGHLEDRHGKGIPAVVVK